MAYLFWDDVGMRSLIEEYEKDFLETYDSILTPVERSDAFRILVCKHFGGVVRTPQWLLTVMSNYFSMAILTPNSYGIPLLG